MPGAHLLHRYPQKNTFGAVCDSRENNGMRISINRIYRNKQAFKTDANHSTIRGRVGNWIRLGGMRCGAWNEVFVIKIY